MKQMFTHYALRIVCVASRADTVSGRADFERDTYIEDGDVDWVPEGIDVAASPITGVVWMTHDRARAKLFTSNRDALQWWKQQSSVKPTRPDGQPNRPFTAYTVEVVPIVVDAVPHGTARPAR